VRIIKTAVTVFGLVATSTISGRTQAPSPAPTIHILAETLRGTGCDVNGLEAGDPAKPGSIFVEKFAPGCPIPWHWHTPNEHVMMVSGTFNFEIKGEKAVQVHAGDFVLIPSHRVSQTTCVGPEPCLNFLYTDAPMDIHFVDDAGAEISLDQAVKNYERSHPKQQ